ncbi:fasciclin domain-containing protein [Butyricimonas faecihominis]|uniref:fasciclin domain-containing protein n=1 Tax=Butyricimonas faecihominis TaxID=1472416 RepID=UPI0032BF52C1
MKNISLVLTIAALMACCDKDNYIDSGTHAQKHDCTVWEYFQTDHANWDSLIVMIKHAGMIEYFDATNKDEITIFAPTNHSINQYLFQTLDNNGERCYEKVADLPANECREMLLSYMIHGKKFLQDFDYEVKGTQTGGTMVQALSGIDLRVYRITSTFYDIPDLGAEKLAFQAPEGYIGTVASCNIEMNNGVVHSLDATCMFTKL